MKAPQIIMIVLMGLMLMYTAYKHKQPGIEYNFWTQCISTGLYFGLLIWGGFFK